MTFRSGLEEKVADLLVTLGVDYEYEETSYPYTIQHQYTPDFVLPHNGVILEVKGYWDPPSRRKIRQVIKDNPNIDLRMVFQDPYKRISKKAKQPMQNGVRDMTSNGVLHTAYRWIGSNEY